MSIVARAYALIVSPRAEWPRIAGEPATIGGLFAGYAMVLAAIPAVAGFIGTVVVGFDLHGETAHMPARTGLPALMRCPPEKGLPCTVAVILCGFAVLIGTAVLSTLALLWLYDISLSLSG